MSRRTLVLLRHAKAAQPGGLSDFDRPLTPRGHADAGAAGAWLAKQQLVPDLVLCSPARRTRETWQGVRVALGADPTVRYEHALYDNGAAELIETLRGTGPEVATVIVIGHNPTVSVVSVTLDPDHGDGDGLRTAGVAVHRFDGDWTDLDPSVAQLTATHTARA